ncbi:MAG: hypothetical protein V8R01_02595 [Bacilli bacterium]
MITKDRASSIISLLFIGIILVLTINLVSQFTFVDFAYLIFLIGCFAEIHLHWDRIKRLYRFMV